MQLTDINQRKTGVDIFTKIEKLLQKKVYPEDKNF